MAQVRLWINPRENAIYDLPRVCMKCGADATSAKLKQFVWYPPWTIILIGQSSIRQNPRGVTLSQWRHMGDAVFPRSFSEARQ